MNPLLCEDGIENPTLGITVCHHLVTLMMPNSDPWDQFFYPNLMIESIYHMTLRLLLNLISAVKTLYFCHYVCNVVMDVITFPVNL